MFLSRLGEKFNADQESIFLIKPVFHVFIVMLDGRITYADFAELSNILINILAKILLPQKPNEKSISQLQVQKKLYNRLQKTPIDLKKPIDGSYLY